MLFPTIDFAIFFAVAFTANWVLNPYPRLWKLAMIAASYVFYSWWDWRFVFLLAAVNGGDHFLRTGTRRELRATSWYAPWYAPSVARCSIRGVRSAVFDPRRSIQPDGRPLTVPAGWWRRRGYPPRSGDRVPPSGGQPLALIASMSFGSTLCTSPTMPRSATEKMGASWSLLMATMFFEFFMPTRCWVAPEIPQAR